MDLTGYELSPLRDDGELTLYRARQTHNPTPLLVLVARGVAPARGATRVEHEYALGELLDPRWAARPLALERRNGTTTLVLEDSGGELLERFLGRPLELTRFLRLAIQLAGAVGQVHRQGLIHKDVRPANVLVDARAGVHLIGFGIASQLPRERQVPAAPEVIAGTFAYMAPEQTGRMNRSIDGRSDLYSLGVTLYEMLTGALPFTASEPMEWIHCHVARKPVPPSARLSGIEPAVEAIILKLLAKTAEDRYQTAAGVEADLRRCLAGWEAGGRIEPFALGAHDVSDRLLIPEKLYGRAAEIAALVATFDRVVTHGTTELVLVSGYSGVGKSSVVNELHKVLVPTRGLFAAGKFEQYKRDIPYATLAQAFQGLVREILGKDDAAVAVWRQALLEALGTNGGLIVGLIPELALIIGEPPPVPGLAPQDAQHRFQAVFRRFLGVFARPEHPLALFLDDLQWLDSASLDLIEHLVTHPEVRHLLLVGAYRDNEVGAAHPLRRTLELVRKAQARAHEIVLAPLAPDDVGQLVADSLRCGAAQARPLAALIYEKTAGNPFFAIQFLTALPEEGLLAFDHRAAAWRWDLPRIRAKGLTDNVIELMAAKLGRLPAATQDTLGQLACLGNVANVAALALVRGASEDEIHARLWEAVRAGFVVRLHEAGAYAFLHDRVHEAAYALIPEGERAAAHLRIGRMLAASRTPDELEERIFDITNHLNRGAGLITSPAERERLAALDLAAATRARSSTAYASALAYLRAGQALLGEDRWERQYPLAFALELHRAECEFLTGDAAAEERLSMLADRARGRVDAAAVASLRQVLYTTRDRLDRSIEVALEYLRTVGVDWSAHPTHEEVVAEHQRLFARLGSRAIEAMAELPRMSDPEHCATVEVLTELVPAAYFSDLDLCSLVVFRIANLAFEHGNSNGSVYAYSLLGFLLRTRFGDHAAGFSFGTLALELAGRRGLDRFRARVYLNFAYCVNPWTRHIKTGRPLLRRGLTAAHETGDLTFAAYLHYCLMTDLLASGDPLDEAQREAEHGLEFAARARFGLVVDILTGHLRLIRALRGLTVAPGSFDEAGFDEARFEQHLEGDPGLANPTCVYWIRKLMARYFAGDFPAAVAAAAKAEPLLWTSPASFESAEYHFYAGLARAAHHDQAPPGEQANDRQALAAHHRRVAAWAEPCPDNFENRALALAAELARIDGQTLEAMRLYDGAIRSAREHGFVHNEGLAHELAARFHAGLGFETSAGAHLEKARACYARWGATGKVRELERTHPQLRAATPHAQGTAELLPDSLDLATVMKVSQAVSAEIDPTRLIDTLMRTALGHAGADRGLLIRPHGDELRVEADAMSVGDRVEVRRRQAPASPAELPESVLRYVVRTRDSLLVDDASAEGRFAADPYVRRHRCRSILCLPLIKQGSLVAILYLENSLAPRVFTPARIAVLKMLASQAAVSLDNARLFAELSHLEAYLAEAQRLSLTGSFGWRISSGEIFWSTQTYEIFELDPAVAPTLQLILGRLHRDDVGRVQEFIARTQGPSADEDWELDYRIMVAGGGVKELHILGHRHRDELGDVEYVGAVMDVTAARQAQRRLHASLEEKDALLKEVHHRVKNNLQLVSSLLNLQAARIADPAVVELFADCRNRVRSMVMVHENLYRAGTFARISMAMHIETLCAHLTTVHGLRGRNIELTTAIDDVDLDLDRAISIGLITNELVSNAVKYAFPEGRAGRVGIALRHLGARRCALEVNDDGIGLPADLDAATADSLGLQLVHDLADQLHGEMTVSRTGGTAFTVTFDAD